MTLRKGREIGLSIVNRQSTPLARQKGLVMDMTRRNVASWALATCVWPVARAAEPWKWEHFGADPYATSRDAAMQARESAFAKLGFPAEVVMLLVKATELPGEKTSLQNGDKFAAQLSKGGVVHGLKEGGGIVAFEKPVRGIRYVADAELWEVFWQDKVYTLYLPEVCFNWTAGLVSTKLAVPKFATSAPVLGECPQGYVLKANAWELSKLPEHMRKQAEALIAAAARRDTKGATDPEAYKPDDVSRTLGKKLREEVKTRAQVSVYIPVQLRDPNDPRKVLGAVGPLNLIDGVGQLTLTKAQRDMVIETIWPADFISPTRSGGAARIWLFPNEWGSECSMNVHGVKP
ncbi:MAG: hypothetical protein AAB442_02875 [Patescibacteria group bacterium]